MFQPQDSDFHDGQNGNELLMEDRKESVLQILSETLRRPRSRDSDSVYIPVHDEDEVPDPMPGSSTRCREKSFPGPDEMTDFNPGDRLCSSVPPLASKTSKVNRDPCTGKFDYIARNHLKDCHLSSVLHTSRRCVKQLASVKKGLTYLISKDEQLSQGKKIANPGSDYELIAKLGESVMILTRQAFTPAHQMYTAALGLHLSEDLIRNPLDPTLLDFKTGYIIRVPWTSIIHTQMKLRSCVDSAIEMYHRFGRENASCAQCHRLFQAEQMQNVMILLMHAFQDLYATSLGCNDIFKVLLHIEDYGEKILQDFLKSLESIERSELLAQVQSLRRSFDDIVINLEQLGWAAYVVYRLASGKSVTPSPNSSISKISPKVQKLGESDQGSEQAIASNSGTRSRSRESRHHQDLGNADSKDMLPRERAGSRRYESERDDMEKRLKSSLRKGASSSHSTRSRLGSPPTSRYDRSDDMVLSKHSSKSSSKSSVSGSRVKEKGSKSKYNESDGSSHRLDLRSKKHKSKSRSPSLDSRGLSDSYRDSKSSSPAFERSSSRSKSKEKSGHSSSHDRHLDYHRKSSKER